MRNNGSDLLDIVIPCFNEGLSIKDLVNKCNSVSAQAPINFILVDNGSTDDTWQQLLSLTSKKGNIRTLRIMNNIGYGHGIHAGLMITEATYVGWIHADLQTNPEDLIQIANWLLLQKNSVDIFVKGHRKNRALVDKVFSFSMSVFETLLFQRKMYEINAQPTIFSRTLVNKLNGAPLDFMFDLYVYCLAAKNGYSQKRFFVNFGLRKYGQSSWNRNIFSRLKFIYRTMKYSFLLRFNVL